MRIIIRITSLDHILKSTQYVLFACALLFLGYCGFVIADAWMFQRRENVEFEGLVRERKAGGQGAPRPAEAAKDGLVGRIVIPRLALTAVVVEGIGKSTLRRGVGHIPGTALPGQAGNVGIAGHRDTVFRPLKDLRVKDEIQVLTLDGDFRYVVESLRVVDPKNVGVLEPSSENTLTLVTCYPFFYIGAAPQRFVVTARQSSSQTIARFIVE